LGLNHKELIENKIIVHAEDNQKLWDKNLVRQGTLVPFPEWPSV